MRRPKPAKFMLTIVVRSTHIFYFSGKIVKLCLHVCIVIFRRAEGLLLRCGGGPEGWRNPFATKQSSQNFVCGGGALMIIIMAHMHLGNYVPPLEEGHPPLEEGYDNSVHGLILTMALLLRRDTLLLRRDMITPCMG